MAAGSRTIDDFGHVSRTVGAVFRYALLAATLVGIVALVVLLAYVSYDAIQPQTADPGWYAVYLLTFVAPTVLVGGYLYRRAGPAVERGVFTFGFLVVGVLFSGGASLLFVDIVPPLVWLSFYIAFLIPVALAVGLQYVDVPFVARSVATLVVALGSLWVVPGFVQNVPFVPTDWLIVALTIGGPVALVVGSLLRDRFENSRVGATAGAVALLAAVAAGPVGIATGLGGIPATILASFALVPVGVYVAIVAHGHPEERIGLLLPLVVVLGALLGRALVHRLGFAGPQSWLDWQFLTSTHSSNAAEAGVYAALGGTILLMILVALLSFPVGVGAAIYLEEYAPNNRITRLIDVNISNLAGVPSVVYGLLGLGLFVNFLNEGIPFLGFASMFNPGTLLVGGVTLSLLILPIVIVSAREAIRAVPDSMRQASYGMGATRYQTVRNVVLPEAFPGILTGTILSLGRAIGETAPLLVIGAPAVFDLPTQLDSAVGALPLQVYTWASTFADPAFYTTALAAGVVTLLVVLLTMNSVAIVLRNRYERDT